MAMDDEAHTYFELFKDSPDKVAFKAGQVVFQEGDPGKAMYVVNSGRVELRHGGRVLEVVEKGGIIGELAIVDRSPRSATAVALTDCELVSIERKRFGYFVGQMPYFAVAVMEVMANRLRRRTDEATSR